MTASISSRQVVFGEGHEIGFDYLVLACGARHSYFGHPEWEEFAPGLKTLEQATEMRRRMLVAFERAENETDPDVQRAYLTFVVVGAGPTGVELAGAIADISRTAMRGDFRRIDPSKAHIVLLEAAPRVLTAFSDELSERARRDLAEIGVEVRTNAKVEAIDAQGVTIGSQRLARADGVLGRRCPGRAVEDLTAARRRSCLAHQGRQRLFGSRLSERVRGWRHGVAGDGAWAARSRRGAGGDTGRRARRPHDSPRPRRRASDGRSSTSTRARWRRSARAARWAQIGRLKLTGRIAWFAWLLIHVYQLIGFRNRLAVLFNWAWNYMFSKRGARLITEKEWKLRN